jgi:flagella basal body P-ring formation protein FlgA
MTKRASQLVLLQPAPAEGSTRSFAPQPREHGGSRLERAALLAAGAVCVVSFTLALLSFAAQAAGTQTVSAADQRQFVLDQAQAALGEPVELVEHRPLPALELPAGKLELALRFPHPAGQWLPSALEAHVDGRLVAAVPLGAYADFKLPVLVAKDGLARGAAIDGAGLTSKTLTLAPGQEVLTDQALADGLTARGYFGPGMRLKLSRLAPPPLVRRGMAVQLIEQSGGIKLSASSTALADGFAGQALSVRRDSDGRVFRGVLQDGDSGAIVVVQ